jgi:phage baseplate assembly protein W
MSKAKVYGYNPPFIGGSQNIMSRQEDKELIQNDLLQLLLTVPGERVMRPSFGVNLRNFVFEDLTDIALEILRDELQNKIAEYERRIKVRRIDVIGDTDRLGVQITIAYTINSDPSQVIVFETFVKGIVNNV